MFISVVIPLYNKEEFIKRSINSVLNQSFQDFELIIVDDGSSDNSFKKALQYKYDKRVKLYQRKNAGVSRTRNFGADVSLGSWVAFLDADDEYKKDFLSRCASFIDKNKRHDISLVGTNYIINECNEVAFDLKLSTGIHNYFDLFKGLRSPIHSSSVVVNRSKLESVNGFPDDMDCFEDWATWIKLSFTGKFGYINEPLSVYHNEINLSKKKYYNFKKYLSAKKVIQILKCCIESDNNIPKTNGMYFFYNDFVLNLSKDFIRKGYRTYSILLLGNLKVNYLKFKSIYDFYYISKMFFPFYKLKKMIRKEI